MMSYYKLHAISKAAGILKKESNRSNVAFHQIPAYMKIGMLISSYGFKITDGVLKVPMINHGRGKQLEYFDIPLNKHAKEILSDPAVTVRSFALANNTVSIS